MKFGVESGYDQPDCIDPSAEMLLSTHENITGIAGLDVLTV